jgi:hypothetical protein
VLAVSDIAAVEIATDKYGDRGIKSWDYRALALAVHSTAYA